jgi:putative thioredoxin|tara:strand:- start:240 stop:1094 length:855 start_codon:yes stop_codon:yes gene_type:complete
VDAKPTVFEIDPRSFQTDVVERSKEVPIVLLFWTQEVAPSVDTKTILEKLAGQYQGKFALGLSDIAGDQSLAQQLRIQGIPSIRVIVDGQLTEQMEGPQGETAIKELLDKLTMSNADLVQDQLGAFLSEGNYDGALTVLQQALNEEPNNPGLKIEWADILILQGDLDGARTVMATISEDVDGYERPTIRLEIAEEAAGMGSLDEAQVAVDSEPSNLEEQYRLSILLAQATRYEESLDHAMHILQVDREFRDDIGRMTMIRVMTLLPKDSDVVKRYRRRMFNFMH